MVLVAVTRILPPSHYADSQPSQAFQAGTLILKTFLGEAFMLVAAVMHKKSLWISFRT